MTQPKPIPAEKMAAVKTKLTATVHAKPLVAAPPLAAVPVKPATKKAKKKGKTGAQRRREALAKAKQAAHLKNVAGENPDGFEFKPPSPYLWPTASLARDLRIGDPIKLSGNAYATSARHYCLQLGGCVSTNADARAALYGFYADILKLETRPDSLPEMRMTIINRVFNRIKEIQEHGRPDNTPVAQSAARQTHALLVLCGCLAEAWFGGAVHGATATIFAPEGGSDESTS